MIINYSRLSQIEDPVEKIRKELNKNEYNGDDTKLGFLRESMAAIGHSFIGDRSREKMTPQKKNINFSFNDERTAKPQKKGHRSKGIFDTLFNPLSVESQNPEVSHSRPLGNELQEMKKPKDLDHANLETEDDFFGEHLNENDRMRHRGTVAVSSTSSFEISNLTSIEIIGFYRNKSKEFTKLLNSIGINFAKRKEGSNQAKWVSSIIEKYVNLLICTTVVMEEIKKLDAIKYFFALKIERIIDEKNEAGRNINRLKEEIKAAHKETEVAREEERKARIRLMEKSAEFTVRMDELLNIKDEREKAFQMAKNSEKKLKEAKRVRFLH